MRFIPEISLYLSTADNKAYVIQSFDRMHTHGNINRGEASDTEHIQDINMCNYLYTFIDWYTQIGYR